MTTLVNRFVQSGKDLFESGTRCFLYDFGRGVKVIGFGLTPEEGLRRHDPMLSYDDCFEYTDITNLIDEYEGSVREPRPGTEENYVGDTGQPDPAPYPFGPALECQGEERGSTPRRPVGRD